MLSKIASSEAVCERLAYCKHEAVLTSIPATGTFRSPTGRAVSDPCEHRCGTNDCCRILGTRMITDVVAPPKIAVTDRSIQQIPHGGLLTAGARVEVSLFPRTTPASLDRPSTLLVTHRPISPRGTFPLIRDTLTLSQPSLTYADSGGHGSNMKRNIGWQLGGTRKTRSLRPRSAGRRPGASLAAWSAPTAGFMAIFSRRLAE